MKPLQSYRLLDFSRYLPGPFCSMILADLGMEVLKVEPVQGDPVRHLGPKRNRDSAYFLAANRNKGSIAIDIRSDEGKEICHRLCSCSNVLLESSRPGTMEGMGLGYPAVHQINPSLIYCSLSGFGQEGPYRDRAAHDINHLALTGFLLCGRMPNESAVLPGVTVADLAAGLFAALGILAALLRRNMDNEGGHLDISIMDSMISFLCYQISQFNLADKPDCEREDVQFNGSLPYYRIYETSDHHFMAVGAVEKHLWEGLCRLIGHPGLSNKQYATGQERQETIAILKRTFRSKKQREWQDIFEKKDVGCDPVSDVNALLADPQVAYRRMIVEIDHPSEGKLFQAGNPIRLSGSEQDYTPPPRLGENTTEVLEKLGYSRAEIARLKKKSLIA